MLDLGWSELMMIAVLTVIVVGPKKLPRVLRTVTQGVRKVRNIAGEFQSSLDDMAREADMEDLQKQLREQANKSMQDHLNTIDPSGETAQVVDDVKSTVSKEVEQAEASAEEVKSAAEDADKSAGIADKALEDDAMGDEPTSKKKESAKKSAVKKARANKATAKKKAAKKSAKKSSAKKPAAKIEIVKQENTKIGEPKDGSA